MTRKIPFWKLQAIGNDFPLVHLADIESIVALEQREIAAVAPQIAPGAPENAAPVEAGEATEATAGEAAPEADAAPAPPVTPDTTAYLSRLTQAICDRHYGVGGDGLLAVGMEGEALRLRMFNPDGTEDFCGNGIRCAVLHAHRQGWVGTDFVVKHLDRDVPAHIEGDEIHTTLGLADYTPEKVPHKAFGELFNATIWNGVDAGLPMNLFGSALTTGSTHVVIPTQKIPNDEGFRSVSAKIEVDPLFPDRASVIWAQEVVPDKLLIRIWERGVGETLGCGTGASAAAADYLRRQGRGGTVEVTSRGGTLKVRMTAWHEPITLIGVAQAVFSGEYEF